MKKLVLAVMGSLFISTAVLAAPIGGVAPINQDSTPNTTAINNRIDSTLRLIHENVRTGTITKAQGQTLLTQLQTAINQFVGYLNTNNMADLNLTQYSILKGQFDNLVTGLTPLPTPVPTVAVN